MRNHCNSKNNHLSRLGRGRLRLIQNQNRRREEKRWNQLQVEICQKNFRAKRTTEVPPRRRRRRPMSPTTTAPRSSALLHPEAESDRPGQRKRRASKPRPPRSQILFRSSRPDHLAELNGSLCFGRRFSVTSHPVLRLKRGPSVPDQPRI